MAKIRQKVNVFWFRRDLRLHDNAGLYHALKADHPVLPVFIFDKNILDDLEDSADPRVTFIYKALEDLNLELKKFNSSMYIVHDTAENAWERIVTEFDISTVFTNHDYEPYATQRDDKIRTFLAHSKINFLTFKDQVIFEKNEILKEDGKPYTVFTPYRRKWLEKLNKFYLKSYPNQNYFGKILECDFELLPLESLGFKKSSIQFPDKKYQDALFDYEANRDFPALDKTSHISVHLRFGTVSIRDLCRDGNAVNDKKWLIELIWRDFYMMILWHFPKTVNYAFKPNYDRIEWRNDETEFRAWCEGKTGYPIVDAGMRQLNTIGWMHNRVRMITASFLTKHLLIDWRWGEAYFARKLIDYEQASNVGGWQWAFGSGNDAAPYFRVFSPDLQEKKFDKKREYIKKWVPEVDDPGKYPRPIVDHKKARERALAAFKKALQKI